MVSNVSMGRNGVSGFLLQRATALVMLAYIVFLGFIFLGGEAMNYAGWRDLFSGTGMRVFTLLALVSLCVHAWTGMWTIATDYFTPRMMGKGATAIRLVFELLCLIVLFAYLAWGVQILWSI